MGSSNSLCNVVTVTSLSDYLKWSVTSLNQLFHLWTLLCVLRMQEGWHQSPASH